MTRPDHDEPRPMTDFLNWKRGKDRGPAPSGIFGSGQDLTPLGEVVFSAAILYKSIRSLATRGPAPRPDLPLGPVTTEVLNPNPPTPTKLAEFRSRRKLPPSTPPTAS